MSRLLAAQKLIAGLSDAKHRDERARELARHLGSDDLLILIPDPELRTLIPARGLSRVLPATPEWEAFLCAVTDRGRGDAIVSFGANPSPTQCYGWADPCGIILVLTGGDADQELTQELVWILPWLGAAFRSEQLVVNAHATMSLARNAARQLREQAVSLEQARRMAHEEVIERRRAEEALRAKAVELERSNRDLQQFGAIVSHDLQEPLRMVSSYLALVDRKFAQVLDPKAREYIGYAVSGADRMSKLIRALLAYAQVGSENRAFIMLPLENVVHEALGNLDQRITETSAIIQVDDLPSVHGDHILLVQLFQNLIHNALKFRRADAPEIHIDAEQHPDGWQISVSDNGIGISPEHRDRIFAVFQRLHTQEEFEGTGIGLATCRRIVERHGGRLWVEPNVGAGSIFRFVVPGKSASARSR